MKLGRQTQNLKRVPPANWLNTKTKKKLFSKLICKLFHFATIPKIIFNPSHTDSFIACPICHRLIRQKV